MFLTLPTINLFGFCVFQCAPFKCLSQVAWRRGIAAFSWHLCCVWRASCCGSTFPGCARLVCVWGFFEGLNRAVELGSYCHVRQETSPVRASVVGERQIVLSRHARVNQTSVPVGGHGGKGRFGVEGMDKDGLL